MQVEVLWTVQECLLVRISHLQRLRGRVMVGGGHWRRYPRPDMEQRLAVPRFR